MVVYHYKLECCAKNIGHYLQGHREGSYNKNMIVYIEVLYLLNC